MRHHQPHKWLALFVCALASVACSREPGSATDSASGAGEPAPPAEEVAGTSGSGRGGAGASGQTAISPAADGGKGGHGSAGSAGKSASLAGAGGQGGAGAAAPSGGGTGGVATPSAAAGTTSNPVTPAAGSGAALGPDCVADPLASKRPFGSGFYQQFTGLFGCTAPADLALYRKMLPEKFAMPADPQVCFYIIDFKISSVGRYHEAAILIPTTYKGQSGKYVLTMDLDNRAATSGGRALGFPKYMGEVTLEQNANDWVGTASVGGEVDLRASYTGECTKSADFLWPDFFNLTPIPSGTTSSQAFLPPRTGSVLRVPAEYLEPPTFYSLKGGIKLEINDKLPWNGLVDETKPFPGLLSHFVGGINLGNQALD